MIFKLSELKSLIKSTINETLDVRNEEVDLGASKEDKDDDDEEDVGIPDMTADDGEDEGDDAEVSSFDDVPGTMPGLRLWLRDFVAPQVPLSQIPAFHRFVKLFLNKAKEMELKTREPSLKKRLGPDAGIGEPKKKAPKKDKLDVAPMQKKKSSKPFPPKASKKGKRDDDEDDEDDDK